MKKVLKVLLKIILTILSVISGIILLLGALIKFIVYLCSTKEDKEKIKDTLKKLGNFLITGETPWANNLIDKLKNKLK